MKKTTILVTALIALFMAVGCKGNTPESVVNDFYTATRQNDYAKAMTFTTSSPQMSEVTIQILENMGMVIHHFEVINTDIEDGDSLLWHWLHFTSVLLMQNIPTVSVGILLSLARRLKMTGK